MTDKQLRKAIKIVEKRALKVIKLVNEHENCPKCNKEKK